MEPVRALGDEALLERAAPRDSRPDRATTQRSAPVRGSTRSARGPVSRSPPATVAGPALRTGAAPGGQVPIAAPSPSATIATRLPSPIARATPNPTASGRQLVSRSSPTWIDMPTAARATRIRVRAIVVERGRLVGVDQADRPQRRERQEPEHEQWDGPSDAAPRRTRPRLAAAGRPGGRDQEQQRRHQRVADQLDDGRDVERARAERGTGGDDLARVVDGHARPQPERRLGQDDRPTDRRVEEDRECPEQGDRRDRVGDLAGTRPDDRRRRDDRRVATHRRADGDEHGQPALDVDESRQHQHDRERGGHRDDDEPGRRQPDPGDLGQAEPRPEQDDAESQDALRAERRPGASGRSRGPATAATTMPSRSATETSATIEGRNPVTSRATMATATAAASPGAIDRGLLSDSRMRGQDGASLGLSVSGTCRPTISRSPGAS